MTANYLHLLKLSKQLRQLTPNVPVINPYRIIINRAAKRFDDKLVKLYIELLEGIAKLQHIYNYKNQVKVTRHDMLITLSMMQDLLKAPVQKYTCSDVSIDWYGLLRKEIKQVPFTVLEACAATNTPKSTVKHYLQGLVNEKILSSTTPKARQRKHYNFMV